MKLYNINIENVYPDAKVIAIPEHEDRAIIFCVNHMSNHEYYPAETEAPATDGSILLYRCMGFDPEEFDPHSQETRQWVEEWSYPIEIAKSIVKQINQQ